MTRYFDEEQALVEHRLAVEEMASAERIAVQKLNSQRKIAELKVSAAEKRKVRERVLVAVAKLPILPGAIAAITLLLLFKREVPKQLIDFIVL